MTLGDLKIYHANILILMHDATEGPGTLLDYLKTKGAHVTIKKLFKGENIQKSLKTPDAVISMGGPMSVYEEEAYPFLREETQFLKSCIEKNTPVLGICLGAQMIAKAAGASIYKAPEEETGLFTITLTNEGKNDPIFSDLPSEIPVFQWHKETFDIPLDGTLLATSPTCLNQAFRIGQAYGFQFHLEIKNTMLSRWFSDDPRKEKILKAFAKFRKNFEQNASNLYRNFFDIIATRP